VSTVVVSGQVTQRGTRGPILVFAYTDLAPGEDPAVHEPASLATLGPDGRFALEISPAASLTFVFLADGANDGAVDQGDPIALLRSPDLADLQAGDQVRVSGAKLDFTARRVDAAVQVVRAPVTPQTATAQPTG
jgi:hypothetical protein